MSKALPQLRVLVIDDNVDNAEALCAVLEVMGCQTRFSLSGSQGIATSLAFQPHLALIDLEMPGMGGCEVVQRLRAHSPDSTATLVCLTGRGQAGDRRMCLDAGFDDFYTKPIALESLAALVSASDVAR